MTLYHGGPPGLTEILPSSRTGQVSQAKFGGISRSDRVYVTTSFEAARLFACGAPVKGPVWVYEVEPIGELVQDPDCKEGGLAFECESARVVRVVKRIGQTARRRVLRGLALEGALPC